MVARKYPPIPSIFQNLYKYTQSEKRNQKENFLTEIFAYCLLNDNAFRNNFLNEIGINESIDVFSCNTQHNTDELGRPDVLVKFNDTIMVIECKIESGQEETQLERYAEYLMKQKTKKRHLIYLTKYSETPNLNSNKIKFTHLRWYKVYNLLSNCETQFSKELSNYLKAEKMSKHISFSEKDNQIVSVVSENVANMKEFLNILANDLKGLTKKKFSFDKELKYASYGIRSDFFGAVMRIGFFQYENDTETQISISIDSFSKNHKKYNAINKYFILKNWDYYDNDKEDKRTWYSSKPFSFFIENDTFKTESAIDFLLDKFAKVNFWTK